MRMRLIAVIVVATAVAGCSRRSFERFFTSGERYLTTRQFAAAAIEFENAARANPKSIDAQMKLGDSYAALGQTSNAAAAYQRACALDQKSVPACVGAPQRCSPWAISRPPRRRRASCSRPIASTSMRS